MELAQGAHKRERVLEKSKLHCLPASVRQELPNLIRRDTNPYTGLHLLRNSLRLFFMSTAMVMKAQLLFRPYGFI
jgi:hypothetical protein